LTPGSVDADHAAGSHSEPLTSNLAPEGVIVPTISTDSRAHHIQKTQTFNLHVVIFQPSLAQKPWLWLGLRWLWPAEILGQAKATTHGLALAWPGPSHSFWGTKLNNV